ncbi:Protein farnesyltransferase/geranylgeranyltransferase type-1 subunit alpha [Gracilariopsis chorda]|uniref:Protein farnesyltransferase/geranylgeranyltransferase type-1 subunit alpha n=1 Tax=Gracilariopsis chorda TaxID=448386 RepID=A0A2V3IRF2_9FLOR|nr:Protein farnesyltransferase/geranylgeranyltransferase type-1 subunit alpha [Gracilariopsis chorda]|eukprot:PXF44287.1 Protein farnesyltransferase/geranylgeranyltransferase type-1 subunit alpha [Gracilariopsis chorda]
MPYWASIITNSAKNYHPCEYRRFCVSKFGYQHQRDFADIVLAEDEKKYHAWAHRACLVRNGLRKADLEATESYITRNVRSNSAGNHRLVVLTLTRAREERGEEEMQFELLQMKLADRNEAVVSFIQALYERGIGCELALEAAREAIAKTNCACMRGVLLCAPH